MVNELKVENVWRLVEVNSQSLLYLSRSLDFLAVFQRRLSKKQKGAVNRDKARIRVARMQERLTSQRKDSLH